MDPINSVFDEDRYLEVNPDVRAAIERGEIGGAGEHFYTHGIVEGREAFWTVVGKYRSYPCDALLIDGIVDVMGQYHSLKEQKLLDVHFYIISDDPGKFPIQEEKHRITPVELQGRSPHHVVHHLAPSLESQFMVFSAPYLVDLNYVRSQINRLQNNGREVLIRLGFEYGNLVIVRRNTFLDMGGFCDTPHHYLEDLIQRAKAEERPFDVGGVLRSASEDCPSESTESLRQHAIGYKQRNVAADVVLPFYGHLPFVEESIRSVVDQDHADVVVHLIDDCSREDTTAFLRRWASHKNVRVYRNNMNIGQFITVNNIAPFLETDYLVIQDGDDLSVSQRIHAGINLMELTGSDLSGSRMRVFGDEYEWVPVGTSQRRWEKRGNRYWNAAFPHEIGGHYLPNPTVIMTKRSFVDLGGYPDFGDVAKNKATVDTDLLYRYFFSGYGVCYSVSSLVHTRRHPDSCTQNDESGWSTPARTWTNRKVARRKKLFAGNRNSISSSFGSLGSPRWKECTRRWEG